MLNRSSTRVESVLVGDLIPHIDSTYRTIATRRYRAAEGFSMGGFGAAHLGFKYPEIFGAVAMARPFCSTRPRTPSISKPTAPGTWWCGTKTPYGAKP
jgi:endo-1,4-beta-xylanase